MEPTHPPVQPDANHSPDLAEAGAILPHAGVGSRVRPSFPDNLPRIKGFCDFDDAVKFLTGEEEPLLLKKLDEAERYLSGVEHIFFIGDELHGKVLGSRIAGGGDGIVLGGKIVPSIEGHRYSSVNFLEFNNGTFSCLAFFCDVMGNRPIIDGHIISKCGAVTIKDCREFQVVDGKFNGVVTSQETGARLPVIAGEAIESLEGMKIKEAFNVRNVKNSLNAIVAFEGDLIFPVINGTIIRDVEGWNSSDSAWGGVAIVSGGTVHGLRFSKGSFVFLLNSQPVTQVDGEAVTIESSFYRYGFTDFSGIYFYSGLRFRQPIELPGNGNLMYEHWVRDGQYDRTDMFETRQWKDEPCIDDGITGVLNLKGDRRLPFTDREIVTQVDGVRVMKCGAPRLVSGELNVSVKLEDERTIPIIHGKPILEIDGKRIKDCRKFENVSGYLLGSAIFEDGSEAPLSLLEDGR